MRYSLLGLMDGRSILAGGLVGRKLLSILVERTAPQSAPCPAFLDFNGIEVATSSFLREAVIGFRDYTRQSLPSVCPVVCNLGGGVLEELEFFVRSRGDALWVCDLDAEDRVTNARILGELESAQKFAFDALREAGCASAPDLAERFIDQGIGTTAWNNRLSALAGKGLLAEGRRGKAKTFSLLLEMT